MTYNRLRLVASGQSDSAVVRYEKALAEAERAYMFGQQERVEVSYRAAFQLSIQLLDSSTANKISYQRLIQVCELCFDYCPLPEDSDDDFFLEDAATSLEHIINSPVRSQSRMQALMAYAYIADLARELSHYNGSRRALSIVRSYQRLRAIHGCVIYQ